MYEQDFPKSVSGFLKASAFQGQEIPLTFRGWKKKGNEDLVKKDGSVIPWKKRVEFCLKYSYPEWAIDQFGEKIPDRTGQPFKNRFWDEKYPKGYSILYDFEEGSLESGSVPLFNAFCLIRPKAGDVLSIRRDGEKTETKWTVKRVQQTTGDIAVETDGPDEVDIRTY